MSVGPLLATNSSSGSDDSSIALKFGHEGSEIGGFHTGDILPIFSNQSCVEDVPVTAAPGDFTDKT